MKYHEENYRICNEDDDTNDMMSSVAGNNSSSRISSPSSSPSTQHITDTELESSSGVWKREDVLELISLYMQYESYFKSTSIKNRKVWQMIAKKLPSYTALQCKNKFKYIKRRYTAKVDNMSHKKMGRQRINCKFFEELDNLFRKDHNINPPEIASAKRGSANTEVFKRKPSESTTSDSDTQNENELSIDEPSPVLEITRKCSGSNIQKKQEVRERKMRKTEALEKVANALCSIAEDFKCFVNADCTSNNPQNCV